MPCVCDLTPAMKRIALILFCALSGLTANAKHGVQLSFDFFYNSLEPYGEWASVGDYGYVWHPTDVDEDWTPYSDGYWAYTDAGWTWVSYEDWGGITYHYGRWVRLNDYGWCWVPDYEWGPAWVSWRQSHDYVGWAPLPPEARWRRNTGFGIWVDTEYDIGPGSFRFCHSRDFGAPFIRPVLLPYGRNVTIIEQTINITNITYRDDRGYAFNGGPDYGQVSTLSERPLPALKLVRYTDDVFTPGSRGNVLRNAPQGNTLVVAAPPVAASAPQAPSKQPPVAKSFTAAQVDHGWSAASNDPAHERIRAHFKKQTEGASPQTAPARAFQPGLVAVVPKKADPKAKVVTSSPVAVGRGAQPAIVTPGASPALVTPQKPAASPSANDGRAITSKSGEPPAAAVPPATVTDPRGERRGKKPSKIVETPPAAQPAIIAVPNAPKIAPAPAATPSAPPAPAVVKTPPATPATISEPRGERIGKKPSKIVETPQPAIVPPQPAPRIVAPIPATAPQPLPKIASTPPVQPKDDSAARIAREQADTAAKKRDAEGASRALEQQRAADNARKHQIALDEKRKQDAAASAAAVAADKQRRDAAAAENAHRMAEAQHAAKEQARIENAQRAAEAQRQQNALNARRAADEGHARQVEMQRQQQAAAATETARRQAVAPRAPAPVAAPPPQRAPVQLPPPQARPAPAANPAPAAQGDPRRYKGKDEEEKKK